MPFDPINPISTTLGRTSRLDDYLTNYRFHIMDVSFSTPHVFFPGYGFRFVTSPEIQVDIKEFKEGNFEFPRKLVTGAKCSDLVLHRGARIFDSDFHDWVKLTITGNSSQAFSDKPTRFRRNLLLVQYSDMSTAVGSGQLGPLSFESITQLVSFVPAKAWLLHECIPINYKSGTDFDGIGADLSIAELTISPRYIDEINVGI